MSDSVLVYKGDELASYGFGDPHPFGFDRHDVFQDELESAGFDALEAFIVIAPVLLHVSCRSNRAPDTASSVPSFDQFVHLPIKKG